MLKLNWNSGNNCRQVLIVAMFSFLCSEAVLAGSMNSEGPTTPAKSAPPDLVHGEDSAHKEIRSYAGSVWLYDRNRIKR
jgi:hypothetical protein